MVWPSNNMDPSYFLSMLSIKAITILDNLSLFWDNSFSCFFDASSLMYLTDCQPVLWMLHPPESLNILLLFLDFSSKSYELGLKPESLSWITGWSHRKERMNIELKTHSTWMNSSDPTTSTFRGRWLSKNRAIHSFNVCAGTIIRQGWLPLTFLLFFMNHV